MTVHRPGLVVAVAIILSLPMAPGILNGAIDPTDALVRFLVALVLCWIGATVVGSTFRRYSEQSRRAELQHMMEEAQRLAARPAEEPHPPSGPPPAPPPT